MSFSLKSAFFANARGVTFQDGGGITWAFNASTNVLTATAAGGPGVGTVTSVGLADASTSAIYAISGSPVVAAGTLTFTLKNQNANLVFGGPGTGAAAQPTFRALVLADIPTAYPYANLSGAPAIPVGANPSASVGLAVVNGSAATFMRSDGAPALSQAISPTWTGNHIFAPVGATTAITVNVTNASGGALVLNGVSGTVGVNVQFALGGTAKDFIGVAGVANDGITGAAIGDMYIRSQAGAILFSNSITGAETGRFTPAGQLSLSLVTVNSTAPAAGGAGALPATPAGYMAITIAGVARRIPFYT